MTVQLSDSQSELLNTIARRNGFTDNFDVDTSPGSVKGDNYLGIITRVTLKNKERKLELILKSASTSEAFRNAVPIRNIFCRELNIYKKVFVEFERFQDEFNVLNPFTGHPKLFGTSSVDGQECLVMENMLETGYKLWNRKIPMDSEHIKAVFIEYAKFHSISLAMGHKKPELFNDLTRDIEEHAMQQNMSTEKLNMFIKSVIANGSKALENDPKLLIVWRKFGDGTPEYFSRDMEDSKWNLVVHHGDSWCNNLMFKYEGPSETTRKVSKVCILDWQLAKKGSPAADLTYFFLAHSPKEILYDYKNYLKLYHDTVCENLRDFSCDPEEVFPFSLLKRHWRKFINLGVFLSLMQMKVMQCDIDEVPDFAGVTESGEDLVDSLSFDLKNALEYKRRVKDIMTFVIDTGLICLS